MNRRSIRIRGRELRRKRNSECEQDLLTGKQKFALIEGVNFAGGMSEKGPCALFATSGSASRGGEVSLPDLACTSLTLSSLRPNSVYELRFYGPNVSSSPAAALPGVETEV